MGGCITLCSGYQTVNRGYEIVDFDDPDNFQFPFQVWCNQVKRVRSLYLSYYIGQAQNYQFPSGDAWYWGAGLPFAPCHTVLTWYPSKWESHPNLTESAPGPVYQTVPGGYWFALNLVDTVTGLVTNFLDDLVQKGVVPQGTTYDQISAAIQSQTIGVDPYGLPQGMFVPINNWRSGFVEEINRRKKLLWEREYELNPYTHYWLGYGRTPPDGGFTASGLAYRDEVWWLEPLAETYKVWRIKCGKRNCCCCCC